MRSGKEGWNFLRFLPAIVAVNLILRKFFRAANKDFDIHIFCTATWPESLNSALWICGWCHSGLEFTHICVDGSIMPLLGKMLKLGCCIFCRSLLWNEMVLPFYFLLDMVQRYAGVYIFPCQKQFLSTENTFQINK